MQVNYQSDMNKYLASQLERCKLLNRFIASQYLSLLKTGVYDKWQTFADCRKESTVMMDDVREMREQFVRTLKTEEVEEPKNVKKEKKVKNK